MKTKLTLNIHSVAVMAACIASTATAAERKGNADESRNPSTQRSWERTRRDDRLVRADKASELIGMEVKNYQNEKLGKVDDFAVDLESGQLVEVLLSIGGFLGIGDTLIAVPPGALHHDSANKVLHLDADKAKLKAAPKFEMSRWSECCESNQVAEVYRYYGQVPVFGGTHAVNKAGSTESPRNTDGSPGRERIVDTREATKTGGAGMGHVEKATKAMGMPVMNLQGGKLGKVENLMVDLTAGRLVAVIVSSGGFLGLGDELSAVPPGAFQYANDRNGLMLDATKDSLSRAPHFKSDQWPDLAQPTYIEGVYRSYRMEPYFSTNHTDADNTARNVRDRSNRTLTPLDQGNSQTDIDTTARIRKAVRAEKDMSLNARNVKVITANGRVTLRGTVNSEAEKRRIAEIAGSLASSDNVDNQLEVKSSDK